MNGETQSRRRPAGGESRARHEKVAHPSPEEGEEPRRRPLEGLLVVSVEQAVAAPLATARLADGGARVIKIERPGGDFARGYDTAARGDSSYFAWLNHAKESIELDFKNDEDAALLGRMIARADVFVQNLAPGALERVGLDGASLRERHPRLVTCDISGYGDGEAVRDLKAYDLLVQAESGLASISGGPGEPGRVGVSLCDIGAGVTAHAAILEALLGRATSGRGAGVAVSLFDVAAEWMTVPLIHAETGNGAPRRVGLKHPSIAPYGAFPSRDGALTLISIQNEREWVRLCERALGAPELVADPRFASNVDRVAHRAALDEAIAVITGGMKAEELRRALADASIAYGAFNGVDELAEHVALRRREIVGSAGVRLSLPAHPVRRVDVAHAGGTSREGRALDDVSADSIAAASGASRDEPVREPRRETGVAASSHPRAGRSSLAEDGPPAVPPAGRDTAALRREFAV